MLLMAKQRERALAAQAGRRPNRKTADTDTTFSGQLFFLVLVVAVVVGDGEHDDLSLIHI